MKSENRKSLEYLVLYGQVSGMITIILGIVVIGMDVAHGDFRHVQVGIFIGATGYSFVKIAEKIAAILISEKEEKY